MNPPQDPIAELLEAKRRLDELRDRTPAEAREIAVRDRATFGRLADLVNTADRLPPLPATQFFGMPVIYDETMEPGVIEMRWGDDLERVRFVLPGGGEVSG